MLKRILIFISLHLIFAVNAQNIDSFFEQTNEFFKQNVINGRVDYASIQKGNELSNLIQTIDKTEFTSLEYKVQKAFLINAYNLTVIHQLINNYPTSSPMNIKGFFDINQFSFGGEMLTLNDLENNVLRKQYTDARLHFVLVCGAKGCPPLINKAYTPTNLEKQLETQTKLALNDVAFIKVNSEKIELSELFKWYESDFTTNHKTVIDFINNYRVEPLPILPFDYYSYDWNINALKTSTSSSNTTHKKREDFNLQTYTAGSLLKQGKFDVSIFNALYTQKKSQWMGETFTGFRESYYSTLLQITFGISKNARINLGADIKLASSGIVRDNDAFNGVSEAFQFRNSPTSRVGVSYVGPRIKIQPFKNEQNFTIQSSLLFPTTKKPEGLNDNIQTPENEELFFLDWDRIQSWTQFFYVKDFRKSQLFLEGDLWYRIGYKATQASALDIPFTAIFSYFPTNKLTFYSLAAHTIRHQLNPNNLDDGITTAANFSTVGLGSKYQLSKKINLELLYTKFIRGTNSGLGNTFNIGFRYVH